MEKTAIEKLGDAIVQALEDAPVNDVLCILTGSFVSLTEELMRRHGHDLTKSIKIDGGQNRDITIHPEKGVAMESEAAEPSLPAFDALSDEAVDAACAAGGLYRADFMRAWESLRTDLGGSALPTTQAQEQELPDNQEIDRLRKQVWDFTEAAGIQLSEILRLTQELDDLKKAQELPDERAGIEESAAAIFETDKRMWMSGPSYNDLHENDKARLRAMARAALGARQAAPPMWQFSKSAMAIGVRYWLALEDGAVVHGYYESPSFWTNIGVIQPDQVAAYSDFVVPSHPASEVHDV